MEYASNRLTFINLELRSHNVPTDAFFIVFFAGAVIGAIVMLFSVWILD